jgi:serine/threonine protein phosphatase PrpC
MVQDLVDAGMLQPEEAEHHPNANIITRAVGVARDLRIDTVSGDAKPRDQFLLATDGVTRLLSDAELAAELSANPPAIAARKLIDTVLARGAPDNASLIIVKII